MTDAYCCCEAASYMDFPGAFIGARNIAKSQNWLPKYPKQTSPYSFVHKPEAGGNFSVPLQPETTLDIQHVRKVRDPRSSLNPSRLEYSVRTKSKDATIQQKEAYHDQKSR